MEWWFVALAILVFMTPSLKYPNARLSWGSGQNKFGFGGTLTLTPALSHRMVEGESFSLGRRIQPLWKWRETGLAVPSPVGRVRVVFIEIRLLSDTCFCTNAYWRDLRHSQRLSKLSQLLPEGSFG